MTTTHSVEYVGIPTRELLDQWETAHRWEQHYLMIRQQIGDEIQRRMEEDGATIIDHPALTCELKFLSPTYDMGKLRAIAELVPPEEWAKAFTPAHWGEPTWIEDKYNMTKIKPLDKYGAAVAQIIEAAKIPGAAVLKITHRSVA